MTSTSEIDRKIAEYTSNEALIKEYQGHLHEVDMAEGRSAVFSHFSQHAKIFVFGKPTDWREDSNLSKLVSLLVSEGIKKVFVPDCSKFTAELCSPSDFQKELDVGGIKFFHGVETEGLMIPQKSAVIFRTADCPTIVLHDMENDLLLAAHAGLGSIIDVNGINVGMSLRSYESVVDDIVRCTPVSPHYEIFVLAGISSTNFIYDEKNEKYGEKNKKILSYSIEKYGLNAVPRGRAKGNISLLGIIKCQFERYGFDPQKIVPDGLDTFSDSRLWSHHEASKYMMNSVDGRNCVLVIHK